VPTGEGYYFHRPLTADGIAVLLREPLDEIAANYGDSTVAGRQLAVLGASNCAPIIQHPTSAKIGKIAGLLLARGIPLQSSAGNLRASSRSTALLSLGSNDHHAEMARSPSGEDGDRKAPTCVCCHRDEEERLIASAASRNCYDCSIARLRKRFSAASERFGVRHYVEELKALTP
jgi:hypothetical protein